MRIASEMVSLKQDYEQELAKPYNEIDDANRIYLNIDKGTIIGIAKLILYKLPKLNKLYIKIKNNLLLLIFTRNSLIFREFSYKTYFHIRISYGCSRNCSYCTIHTAVGPLRSKPLELLIEEFKKGLKKGFSKFIINAVESGSYGIDIGYSLSELLDKLTNHKGNYKLLIKSLNPIWVVKYINKLELIVKKQKIEGMIIPIQTSSSRLLRLMNRYSDVEKIKDAMLRLKKADPILTIDTHIIIGFPTETKEELVNTLNLIQLLKFKNTSVSFCITL